MAVRLRVAGHSMTPFIRDGDLVTLVPLSGRRPGRGEVLACLHQGRFVIHRLVGWSGACASTRGDVAPACDDPWAASALLATVARIERGARAIRWGLGPERLVIAWLSRLGLLRRLARLSAALGWSATVRPMV
ncbi:MAG: S24/S26 family peptidase [Vicinamibacteria bacterium]|nr:S24/S26 family peptidase [Vicinamibacteria bacterium]